MDWALADKLNERITELETALRARYQATTHVSLDTHDIRKLSFRGSVLSWQKINGVWALRLMFEGGTVVMLRDASIRHRVDVCLNGGLEALLDALVHEQEALENGVTKAIAAVEETIAAVLEPAALPEPPAPRTPLATDLCGRCNHTRNKHPRHPIGFFCDGEFNTETGRFCDCQCFVEPST